MDEGLFLTREQSIDVDRVAIEEFGIPGIVLMENAGRNCAEQILDLLPGDLPRSESRILIACGGGNNGGDGFVIARHLSIAGCRVQVVVFADRARIFGDAKVNLDILSKSSIRCESFNSQLSDAEVLQQFEAFDGGRIDCFVDCWLGTGAVGQLRKPLDRVIPLANQLDALRVAIDVPTGLDCETGMAGSAVFRADVTLTMVAQKIGFQRSAAQDFIGEVRVLGIGTPNEVLGRVSGG